MNTINRRTALTAIVLPALAMAVRGRAPADEKIAKSQVNYRNQPNGDAQCSGCKYFQPGKDSKSTGTCQIVDGSISPSGWCEAYTAK